MTYKYWLETFTYKRKKILEKLKNSSKEDMVKYFIFEHMVEKEPDFCILYKEKKKCHDIEYLNCLFCACPYFVFNDEGLKMSNTILVKSKCSINSLHASKFVHDGVEHLDCSTCRVPHTKKFATTFLKMF